MIWLTWRQFRTQGYIAAALLVAAATVLTIAGISLGHLWSESGAASCPATGDCAAMTTFVTDAEQHAWIAVVYLLGAALIYLVPPLVGLFWGAPLVARELESGTQRLAWNQSITRVRWFGTKVGLLGLASVAFAGLLSLAGTLSGARLDTASNNRLEPLLFGARGVVPMGYAAFAFVLGVVLGMVVRRTVPAMASTLAIYAAAVLTMALGLRSRLLPGTHRTTPLDVNQIHSFNMHDNGLLDVLGKVDVPGAWVTHNQTINSAGAVFTGPANPQYCGRDLSPKACLDWVGTLGLRQDVVYQPASRFWALQWTEAGVFLALAALLAAFGIWWLRGRRSA
jgi:ABC-type transport system involved in multi-copper enzyme maturation permease subunit